MNCIELLKIIARYLFVWMDRCLRWIFEMLSGPVAKEFLKAFMLFCVARWFCVVWGSVEFLCCGLVKFLAYVRNWFWH